MPSWLDYTSVKLNSPDTLPFLFPTLFGNGQDGVLALTTNSDVGYLGSYGAKQGTDVTLAAGQTLTIAQGTSSGALMLAATGKLTIAGTITGNGGNAATSSSTVGVAGGATAGGGAANTNATKFGHGAALKSAPTLGRGGDNNVGINISNGSSVGGNFAYPKLDQTTTFNGLSSLRSRIIKPSNTSVGVIADQFGIAAAIGTAATTTAIMVKPTDTDIYPYGALASGSFLDLGYIPGGPPGPTGGYNKPGSGGSYAWSGAGGGGAGCVIMCADTIELVSGYAINLIGGNGANGINGGGGEQVGGGMAGCGGFVLMICRTFIGSTAAINCAAGTSGTSLGGPSNAPAALAGGFQILKV